MDRRGFLAILLFAGAGTGCLGSGNDTMPSSEGSGNDTVPSSEGSGNDTVPSSEGSGNDTTPSSEESENDTTPPSEDVINYEELPSDAQNEFVTALEQNGVKECDIALLDVDESIIRYRGEYYTYAVQSGPRGGSENECDKDFLRVEKVEEFS